jgi:[protein-PII] uridylyltransferase
MGPFRQKLHERSAEVDALLIAAWQAHIPEAKRADTCLVAVGGYGRQELFPYSDIDLLVVERPGTLAAGELSEFLRVLWDTGLRMSHSVHPVADCKRMRPGDVDFSVSLLDRRYLSGMESLYWELNQACLKAPPELALELARKTKARHEKFQSTIYHMEPDVKEGPGSLRDLHVIRWLARLAGDPVIDPEIESEFLFRIRYELHQLARRDSNQLRFAEQDELSSAPASLMREYYRHTRSILRQLEPMLERVLDAKPGMASSFLDWRARMSNEEFTVSRDRILLRHPAAFQVDPEAPHRLFVMQARHGLDLAIDTRSKLNVSNIYWNWAQWKELLSQPFAAKALRSMVSSGVLVALLPEWEKIDCLVVRDFHHRYTVDEHTLVALEHLDALSKEGGRLEHLWNACESRALLRLALLLHDIGKGSGSDHEIKSVRIAQDISERMGIPAPEQNILERLIAQHGLLSTLMTTRDFDDPQVADLAAHALHTIEYLGMLTLLTHADSSAVFPGAMTTWRSSQLWHAYNAIHRELTRELEDERIPDETASNPELSAFLKGFPTRYLHRHSLDERIHHFGLAKLAASIGVAVELKKFQEDWLITVVTGDRPRLLADLAGVLAGFSMNILKAEAFGNAQGQVLDIFVFHDPIRTLDLNPDVAGELKEAIRQVVTGKEKATRFLRRRSKPWRRYTPPIQTVIRFDNEASQQATLLELQAHDRPGLLYDVASTVAEAGCVIDTVLLHTEAERAVDVFYLRSESAKLNPSQITGLGEQLRKALNP